MEQPGVSNGVWEAREHAHEDLDDDGSTKKWRQSVSTKRVVFLPGDQELHV
jgi:hypothetical protein|tara:strand:- start:1101 stop:1253 length:153 start_codon:yes stop_codon:yes gene_type:complete